MSTSAHSLYLAWTVEINGNLKIWRGPYLLTYYKSSLIIFFISGIREVSRDSDKMGYGIFNNYSTRARWISNDR